MQVSAAAVVVSGARPDWRDRSKRVRTPVAKFRFVRTSRRWTLYWLCADRRWHRYEPAEPSPDLASLLELVDGDQYGAFFG